MLIGSERGGVPASGSIFQTKRMKGSCHCGIVRLAMGSVSVR